MSNEALTTTPTWTISETLSATFDRFAANWVTLVVSYVIMMAFMAVPIALWAALSMSTLAVLHRADGQLDPVVLSGMFGSIALMVMTAVVLMVLFMPGQLRIAVAAARGERPRIGDLFSGFNRVGALIGAGLLTALAVMGGYILLIVPGIIMALGLSQAPYLLIEEQVGPLEALKASWAMTRGHKGRLLGFFLLIGLITVVAEAVSGATIYLLPLQLAVFLSVGPFSTLAAASVYARLRPRATPAPAASA